uniref:Uncharacterized protein n=1 Tax=Corethron hystrix TaxID=216773 RepID=A0A6U5FFS2_9STRA
MTWDSEEVEHPREVQQHRSGEILLSPSLPRLPGSPLQHLLPESHRSPCAIDRHAYMSMGLPQGHRHGRPCTLSCLLHRGKDEPPSFGRDSKIFTRTCFQPKLSRPFAVSTFSWL